MEGVILATDEMTRLGALTTGRPASLLPVAGQSLLALAIETLVRAEVRRIRICLMHRGGAIVGHAGDGARWGVQIEYLVLQEALGSGGALRWAAPCLRAPFVVLPADQLLDADLAPAIAAHSEGGALASALWCRGENGPARTGAWILGPAALGLLPAGRCDIGADLLPRLRAAGMAVVEHELEGYWNPLDSLADYQRAQRDALRSAAGMGHGPRLRHQARLGRSVAPGIWIGRGSSVHPSARLTPPAMIGAGCLIGRDAEIGPDTVIGDQSVVDAGATVRASTLLERSYVGQLASLDGRIADRGLLIDPASAEAVEVGDPLLLGEARPERPGRPGGMRGHLGGLLLLLAISPLLLLIGVLLSLSTRAWPLRHFAYIGRRPGQDDNEPGELRLLEFQIVGPDGTVGALGHWLWRWDLHRLPRLWSVVSGELALVGVRPLHPGEAARLREEWHQTRYTRPAGFTGLWYVQPRDGYDLDAIVAADVYYAVTMRWRDRLRILLQTPLVWARRRRDSGSEPLMLLYEQIVS